MEGRQPAFDLLGEDERVRLVLPIALLLAALVGCTADEEPTSKPSATPTPTPAAAPPPRPERLACHRMTYAEAVAPTNRGRKVDCSEPHTSQTYVVGDLDTAVDGHLLAVDSKAVMDQVATRCPARLPRFLGATEDELRLSMLRPVWFTASVKESDAGANWHRCDVIAVAGTERLASVTGSLEDALSTPAGRTAYGMCGTSGVTESRMASLMNTSGFSRKTYCTGPSTLREAYG